MPQPATAPRHAPGSPAAEAELAAATDAELAAAYLVGDTFAFEELYRRHHGIVLRRLTRVCGNPAIAEELAQEAFLRAAQRLGSLTGELRFRAWVLRIGSNLGIDHIRTLRRQPVQSIEGMVEVRPAAGSDVVVDTERDLESREDRRLIAAVMGRLTRRHRQVLLLREIEGLDYRSIAERMGVSCSAVETLLFRARGRFREEYAKALAAL